MQALAELGIDISLQRSKSVGEFSVAEFDVAITVCDNAVANCPLWWGRGRVKHIGFPDPAAATGSEAERLEMFRRVRDGLQREVFRYLKGMEDASAQEVYLT